MRTKGTKMKFKYKFNADSLLTELKNDTGLSLDGSLIHLNDCIMLLVSPSFEDRADRSNEENIEMILSGKVDYSTYETKLYFKLHLTGKSVFVCEYWKNEFDKMSTSEFLQSIFEKADEMLDAHLKLMESLKV